MLAKNSFARVRARKQPSYANIYPEMQRLFFPFLEEPVMAVLRETI
jgi:hypothetical protein